MNKNLDKNLKLMVVSATILIVLFIYTFYKSKIDIHLNNSYYYGLLFLFVLISLAFSLLFIKKKTSKVLEKEKNINKTTDKKDYDIETIVENTISISSKISNVTFDDVAGIDSAKEELTEIIDFLNNPRKYKRFGIKLPKGVLLVGPPGVGKTLIAKAVAGEANVPFFYRSGASFVHIYVGMGAKRVRELFESAKKNAPAIIFIDEIDAIGGKRTSQNSERDNTLNELLTQMDGFEDDNGIVVIGATNKIEVLDEALLRAGRFDRRVFIDLPNKEDRKKILKLYLKDKTFDFDIDELASDTSGFSSSALATLINEALLIMIKHNDTILKFEYIQIAKDKIKFGKKEKILNKEEKDILALYQATKAFITKKSVKLFDEGILRVDNIYPSKSELLNYIKGYLAGSLGVEVIKGEPYAIFKNDYKEALNIAKMMVDDYNMAKDKFVIIDEVKSELKTIILENKDKILYLKQIMFDKEEIKQDMI